MMMNDDDDDADAAYSLPVAGLYFMNVRRTRLPNTTLLATPLFCS